MQKLVVAMCCLQKFISDYKCTYACKLSFLRGSRAYYISFIAYVSLKVFTCINHRLANEYQAAYDGTDEGVNNPSYQPCM